MYVKENIFQKGDILLVRNDKLKITAARSQKKGKAIRTLIWIFRQVGPLEEMTFYYVFRCRGHVADNTSRFVTLVSLISDKFP